MAKIRRQIISPHVRFAASSRGPYANRLGGGSYAKTFNIGACFRVVSVSVGDPSSDWFTVCFNDTPDQTGCLTQDFTFRNETRAIDMPTTQAIPGTGDCLQYEAAIGSENPSSGPDDVLTMDYDDAQAAGGPCKLDGSTDPDCELATIVNFPVTNNIFGPIDSEMGDVSNTTLVATFPADVAQTGSTTLTWEVFYDLVPQTINSAVIVNNNEVHFTMAATPNDAASITYSHTRNDGVNACQAVDGRYCWRFVNESVVNNVDTTSPTVPVGLSATATGQTTIDLSWSPSSDAKSGVKEYVVYRASVEIDRVPHPTTTYQDTGLSPETAYNYTVSAVDNKNNESAQSVGDSATTWAPAPNVSAAEVGNVADNIIVVTFDREVVATDYTQGWSFTEDASPVTISSSNKTQATEVQFTLSADISTGTTVAYNYNSAQGNYENTDGVDMENQSGSVTNNVAPPVSNPDLEAFKEDTNGKIKTLLTGGSVAFQRATEATVESAQTDSNIVTKRALVNEIAYDVARQQYNQLASATEQARTTNYNNKWAGKSFTTFPLIDVSAGTDFYACWNNCGNLASFPALDLSSGTDFRYTWTDCSSLTSFPTIDTSKGTLFFAAWDGCSGLTSFPALDLSSGTNFGSAWKNCSSLTSFPLIDVSSGTSFQGAWEGCTGLPSFPALDTAAGQTFTSAWRGCSGLTSFPALSLNGGTDFQLTWQNCGSLSNFPANMFDTCLATAFTNAFANCALTQTSVDNILVSLDTAGQSGGRVDITGGTNAAPGTAGQTAKTNLQGKGWTVNTN